MDECGWGDISTFVGAGNSYEHVQLSSRSQVWRTLFVISNMFFEQSLECDDKERTILGDGDYRQVYWADVGDSVRATQ